MRYPNKKDQEMYNSIRMFMGFGKEEELYKLVNESNDADSWVYRALITCEVMRDKVGDVNLFDYYEEILKYCQKAIELNSKHWLAYYLRSLVGILMEREMAKEDESIHYLLPFSRTPKDWEEERMAVIEMQKEEKSEPFFIIPYLSQALAAIAEWDFDQATDWVQRGLTEVESGPIGHLSSILQIPFILLYQELTEHELEVAEDLHGRFTEMFSTSIA